jgi:NAD-dependent deacetylase
MDARHIVILTGAGISAESGVPTFRDAGGLWEGHRFQDVATPEAFARDPETVQRFYDLRRAALPAVRPNAAHHALARLAALWPGRLTLVTQNVDDLHQRAHAETPPGGEFELIAMHGELMKARCTASDVVMDWPGPMAAREPSPHHPKGRMRPHVVWFGEIPLEMDRIERALSSCDLFVSIGTSGAIWPASGFVLAAAAAGARTLEINLEPSQGSARFDETRHGPASVEVPRWVDEILATSAPAV